MKTTHSTKLWHLFMVLTVLLSTLASLVSATTVRAADGDPSNGGASNGGTVSFTINKKAIKDNQLTQIQNTGENNGDLDGLTGLPGAEFTVYNITQEFYSEYEALPASSPEEAKKAATTVETNLQSEPELVQNDTNKVADGVKTTGDDGKAVFTGLPAKTTVNSDGGQIERNSVYAFAETKTPDNYAPSALLIVALPAKTGDDGTINLYPKDAMVTKTVLDAKADGQYEVGDTLQYKVTTPIPSDTEKLQTFSIADTMNEVGATFKQIDSVTVDGVSVYDYATDKDKQNVFTDPNVFTNKQKNPKTDASSWSMTFGVKDQPDVTTSYGVKAIDALKPYAGKVAVITYTVQLNENAIPAQTLDNNLNVTFGHTPITLHTDKKITPFGGHKFVKEDSKTGEKLGGAEFVLTKSEKNGDTAVVKFAKLTGVDNITDGNYNPTKIEWVDNQDDATKLTTAADGNLTISGFKYGEYSLIETKAPEGYALPGNKVTPFTIDGTDWKTSKIQSIKNTKEPGTILPMTGGMGFILFAIAGIALIGAGFIVMKRGKKANA